MVHVLVVVPSLSGLWVVMLSLRRLPVGTVTRVKPGMLPPLQKQWQGSLVSLERGWATPHPPLPSTSPGKATKES